jgi:hypothetical protein
MARDVAAPSSLPPSAALDAFVTRGRQLAA